MSRTALIALLAVGVLGACQDEATIPSVAQGTLPVDSAEQFMILMKTVLVEQGVKRAEIEADTAYLYDNSSRLEMLGVHGTFYTSTGVNEGIMSARRAIYDMRVDSIRAYGDVTVTSTEGRTLKTPFLRYNKALNEVSSDSIFTISDPDRTTTGIGFVSDPGLNHLQIKKVLSASAGRVNLPDR